jgi:formate dehydrogenase subunit gamma
MCSDRVANGMGPACVKACPTGCLEFGTKPVMLERARHRAAQVKEEGFPNVGVYDPPGVGGTGVVYVLHHADRPELYGGLPREPCIDPQLRLWKGPLKLAGGFLFALSLAAAAIHYFRTDRRRVEAPRAAARPAAAPEGEAPEVEARRGREILRYTVFERVVHWTVASTFVYLMLTGLGLFTPKLAWLLDVLGGGQIVRAWHPIVGCVFIAAVLLLFFKWLRDLTLTPDDRVWLKRLRDYMAGRDENVPPSGRFNAGQKLLFWAQVALGVVLLLSGVPIWLPEAFSRGLRLWALLVHSAAAVLAVLSLVVHVYMALFVTQGALRAMTEGKVSEGWARRHHGKWAEEKLRE